MDAENIMQSEAEVQAAAITFSLPGLCYFAAALVIFLVLLMRGKKKYSAYIEPLDSKKFGSKSMFPIGFVLIDLLHIKFHSEFDRKLRKNIAELHDTDYTEFYLRVYWASSLTLLIVGLLVSSMMYLVFDAIWALSAGLILGIILAYASFLDIKKQTDERHNKISMSMPDLTNKIIILMGAGLTLRACLERISNEMSGDGPLYDELRYSVAMMEAGSSSEAALDHLVVKCNTPEMRRFVSVVTQNMHRGGSELLQALAEIGKEQWDSRKAAANRMAQEATTKMLFPMMLMLVSVIILSVAPAIIGIM